LSKNISTRLKLFNNFLILKNKFSINTSCYAGSLRAHIYLSMNCTPSLTFYYESIRRVRHPAGLGVKCITDSTAPHRQRARHPAAGLGVKCITDSTAPHRQRARHPPGLGVGSLLACYRTSLLMGLVWTLPCKARIF